MKRENWLEWVTLTISSVIVLSTFGYLIWRAATTKDVPADLSVRIEAVSRNGESYDVTILVSNEGDRTAEDVTVEVILEEKGRESERAALTLAYVPYRSERRGTLRFREDPRRGRLLPTVRGYREP